MSESDQFERYTFKDSFGTLHQVKKLSNDEYQLSADNAEVLKEDHGLTQLALRLLHLLASRSEQVVPYLNIYSSVWPDGTDQRSSCQNAINALRRYFVDKSLINTLPNQGYSLAKKAVRDGKLGGIEISNVWRDSTKFQIFVDECISKKREIRISTVGFASPETIFGEYSRPRQINAKVLLLNPWNKALMHARFAHRDDTEEDIAVPKLQHQVKRLDMRSKNLDEKRTTPDGDNSRSSSIEIGVSNHLPIGFLAMTDERALLGLFPAHTSYEAGPLFDISRSNPVFDLLIEHWRLRWGARLSMEKALSNYQSEQAAHS